MIVSNQILHGLHILDVLSNAYRYDMMTHPKKQNKARATRERRLAHREHESWTERRAKQNEKEGRSSVVCVAVDSIAVPVASCLDPSEAEKEQNNVRAHNRFDEAIKITTKLRSDFVVFVPPQTLRPTSNIEARLKT